ncbi:MAG: hypothetical protein NC081_08085 [Roseburia sp.]|nr:hypothetical protein [Roseburia sp.]
MMQKTVYEDYKYAIQDMGSLYIGAKYTLEEILEEENISFKFRLIVERYILPEADRQDTLETHLYYLEPKSFPVKIYKQLKAKVKINILEERKGLSGSRRKQYGTRILSIEQLTAMTPEEKEKRGVVVQELGMSKLALMAF